MSFYHYSPVQGSRNNMQGSQARYSNYRVPPTSSSNNCMQSPGSNQNRLSTSVYGNSPKYQTSGNQYIHASQSSGFQGRQSMSQGFGNNRAPSGRSSTQLTGGPMTVSLPPTMINSANVPRSVQRSSASPSSQAVGQYAGDNDGTVGPDGIKYISLKWEDLLGGKEGMKGLQVSMAPSVDPANPNRQLKFSFATPGQGDAPANAPGEIPLKVVSFQPVDDYPGKGGQPYNMKSQSQQPRMMPALPAAGISGNQTMQQNPLQQQMRMATSGMMNSMGIGNGQGQQPQMIMMPPVYYTPGKGIRAAPGQAMNSCKGCPNCKANATQR